MRAGQAILCCMSVGMADAGLSRNKRGKSVVTVPRCWVNSLATWLEWKTVTQEFWIQIQADPNISPFGIALLPPYKAKKESCVSPISCVLEHV